MLLPKAMAENLASQDVHTDLAIWRPSAPHSALDGTHAATPAHIRPSGSPALPTFPWSTENTSEELDAKLFQRAISTSLLQERPISIYRTNTLSKNRDCRLARIQRSLLWWLLSCAAALMWSITAFSRPPRTSWSPTPQGAVDPVPRVYSSFPRGILGSLGESDHRATK